MRVFLAGGSSVIGRALLPRLLEAGHRVVATSRSGEGAGRIEAAGAEGVIVDVFDRPRFIEAVVRARPEVVLHQLTSIPRRLDPRRAARQLAPTNRLRREGTRILLEAALAAGARRLVAQSIAFVHRPGAGGLRTEDEPLYEDAPRAFRDVIGAVVDLEEAVLGEPRIEGVVLRYGYFYGPDTVYAPGGSFHADVLRRRVPLVGAGDGVFSFIQVDDAAAAIVAALGAAPPGVYQVVDDEPAAVGEWLPVYARLAGARPPLRVPLLIARLAAGAYGVYLMARQPGVSNRRARETLGWTPAHSSWRQGFAAMFESAAEGPAGLSNAATTGSRPG